jgi:hypothetical protein
LSFYIILISAGRQAQGGGEFQAGMICQPKTINITFFTQLYLFNYTFYRIFKWFRRNNGCSASINRSYLLKLFPKKIDIKYDTCLSLGRNGGTLIALAKALWCRAGKMVKT